MNKVIYILGVLFLLCTAEVNAQLIQVIPDSLELYNNSIRKGKVNDSTLIINNTNKKNIPANRKVEILFDPLEPQKKTMVLKTLPK